uniref:peptide deformylase n=1 Tax=Gemmiger formicilis TaxID=745368 RepID=UPI00402961C4
MVRPLMTDTVFLAQKALPADADDIAVADDLLDTLKAHEDGCVGMAANMIGVNKAIIVFDNDGTPCEMFNPVIVYRKGLYLAEEGCLSLQGQRRVRRHRTIKVQWQDRQMQTHVRNFTGWTAQIIQHEIDHCSGILI